MAYPYIIQGSNIVVVIDNVPHTISKTHLTYERVKEAIKVGDWDLVKECIEPKKLVINYSKGNITIKDNTLLWRGKEMNNGLATRMIQMLQEGFPIDPLVNLMTNLMKNPSKRSVQELYGFLEKCNLPITPDGHFLAFKKVRTNYFDIHSGTMDNSVGKILEMERNEVDDNKDQTCSTGLHFCSQEYLPSFGGHDSRVMIVKINPADVVSIPSDYNNAKGRTCRYEVVGEIGGEDTSINGAFSSAVQSNATNNIAKPVAKVAAVKATKTGSTEFYRGYTDGFTDGNYSPINNFEDNKNYTEGFNKGQRDHFVDGNTVPRYQYVKTPTGWTRHPDGKMSPPPGFVATAHGSWPQPKC